MSKDNLFKSIEKSLASHFDVSMEEEFFNLLRKYKFKEFGKDRDLTMINEHSFIRRPNGSRQAPDFLIRIKDKIYNVELKSSRTEYLTWSSVPAPEILYILNIPKISEENPIICVFGEDLISEEEREILVEMNNREKRLNGKFPSNSRWSFNMNIQSSVDYLYDDRKLFEKKAKRIFSEVKIIKNDNDYTSEYLETVDVSYRKKMGQYFTGKSMVSDLQKMVGEYIEEAKIGLEPSVGTGNLLAAFGDLEIDAYDVDENVVEYAKKSSPNVNFKVKDFLLTNVKKGYDLILANPPYVGLRTVDKNISQQYKNLFGNIASGKSDLYILFTSKIIDCLADNGIAGLIIPNSFRTNASAKFCREKIYRECKILNIRTYDNFSKDVSQDVMILILRKKKRKKEIDHDDDYSFDADGNYMVSNSTSTIGESNVNVKVGNFVWNEHKEGLRDIPKRSTAFVLYSSNILPDGLKEIEPHDEKKQFYKGDFDKFLTAPFVAIPRICSKKSPMRALLVEEDEIENLKIVAENHIITISGDLDILKRIVETINSPNFERKIKSSNTISIKEIKNIVIE